MGKWVDLLPEDSYLKGVQLAEFARQEREEGKTVFPPQDEI